MAKLKKENNPAKYFRFLVDSGADYTLISASEATLIGIDYQKIKSKIVRLEVANMNFIEAKKTFLDIIIYDVSIKIPVLITKEKIDGLLGRKGFFEHFDILFQECRQQMIFSSNNSHI